MTVFFILPGRDALKLSHFPRRFASATMRAMIYCEEIRIDADFDHRRPWLDRFLQSQLEIDEIGTVTPARVSGVHRTRIAAFTEDGPIDLALDAGLSTGEIAVGDWVLCDPTPP